MACGSNRLTAREIALFGLLGGLMYVSKVVMQALPNIHLLALLIASETLVFRRKALYPLYTYILLEGLFGGFSTWWIPYLYIWTVLWGVVMLLPKRMPSRLKPLIYAIVCGLHGLAFGILYAPVQALIFGFSWKTTVAWVAAGFPFDCIHGLSDFVLGWLVLPLSRLLQSLYAAYFSGGPALPSKKE